MSSDQRRRDKDWEVVTDANHYQSEAYYRYATLATLMDVRDELRRMRKVLECHNTMAIPQILRDIRTQAIQTRINTTKPLKKRKVTRRKKAA